MSKDCSCLSEAKHLKGCTCGGERRRLWRRVLTEQRAMGVTSRARLWRAARRTPLTLTPAGTAARAGGWCAPRGARSLAVPGRHGCNRPRAPQSNERSDNRATQQARTLVPVTLVRNWRASRDSTSGTLRDTTICGSRHAAELRVQRDACQLCGTVVSAEDSEPRGLAAAAGTAVPAAHTRRRSRWAHPAARASRSAAVARKPRTCLYAV